MKTASRLTSDAVTTTPVTGSHQPRRRQTPSIWRKSTLLGLDLGRNGTTTQHLVSQSMKTPSGFAARQSEVKGDDVITICDAVTITDNKKPLEDSTG
ncbi:hypothetical protein Tco_1104764 [Tanacetum coccineum]